MYSGNSFHIVALSFASPHSTRRYLLAPLRPHTASIFFTTLICLLHNRIRRPNRLFAPTASWLSLLNCLRRPNRLVPLLSRGSLFSTAYSARLGSSPHCFVARSSQPLTPPDSARPPTVTWLALLNSLLRPNRLFLPLLRGSVFSTAYAARIGSSPHCYV